METKTSTIAIERSATGGEITSRARVGRKQLALAGLAVAIALGGIGYGRYWWETARFIESTDDAYAGGNVTAVSPHVAGFVAEILVGDNRNVRAGQLLIRLDARDYRAALAHAQAVAAERQAALAGLEAKYTLQRAMIRQAEADLNAKAARATFATEDAVRYRDLASTGYRTRPNAERTSSADQEAQAGIQAWEGRLAASLQQLPVPHADIAAV